MNKFSKQCVLGILMFCLSQLSFADDDNKYTVTLDMHDGEMTPLTLEVPAGKIIRIEVKNSGTGPVEWESTSLIKEKVLAPGAHSVVVISPKKPGEYEFFDDFHLNKPHGKLIVK